MFFSNKIKPEERKNWLHQQLASYSEPKGFVLLPHKNQFRRRTALGFQTMVLSTSYFDQTTIFELHLGIRNEIIEKTAFQFTNGLPLFQRDSMTLVSAISKLEGNPYQRFDIVKKEDATRAIELTINQLENFGMEWLEKYQTVKAIEQLLNQLPLEKTKYMPNQIYRCFRGLVAAKLSNAENYQELALEYSDFLNWLRAPDYQQATFKKLKNFLAGHSAN